MTTLRSVVAPLASWARSAGIVYVVVQAVVWNSFYAADWWRLTAPALAVAWGVAVTARLRRGRPSPLLTGADSVFYLALALGAQECVPPQIRDGMFSWLLVCMSGQLLMPAWYLPGAVAAALAVLTPAAYWIGAAMHPVTDTKTLVSAVAILLAVAIAHTRGRRQLYGRAVAADGAVREADRAASEQYALLSANIERREHERLLHDTVLNTLTALARAGADDVAEVVNRCRRDVALIEEALGGTDDHPGTGGHASGDLVRQVRAVVADQRSRGLTVHFDIEDAGAPALPARVCAAISNATREALSNVAAHAGTGEAWVRVRLPAQPGDSWSRCRLEVTVLDAGAGFDPVRVEPGRLGLRRSIVERTADCGGQATLRSSPGHGTEVIMSWPASAHPDAPDPVSLVPADRGLGRESASW